MCRGCAQKLFVFTPVSDCAGSFCLNLHTQISRIFQLLVETAFEEYESEEEEPPPRRRQPAEMDRHQLAAEVLGLLQQQRYNQTTARRSHYASWFANM